MKCNKKESKKILFIIGNLQYGGAAKMLKYVSSVMASKYERVDILALYDKSDAKNVDERVNIHNMGLCSKTLLGLWRLTAILKLRKEIYKIKPDLICSFVSDISFLARVASLDMNLIFTSAERGDPYSLPFIWKNIIKWTYFKSDFCFFQLIESSKFFGNNILNKSYIIPNPYISKNIIRYNSEREKVVVSVGRFCDQKRFEDLIRAYALVKQTHPEYKLIIYGDGPNRHIYEKIISDLDLNESVKLPGFVDNVEECISNCSIFVLSSSFEGIPNSLIEAMTLGIPSITTDCSPGGGKYLSDNGRRCILIPVGDIAAMANSIVRIIEDSFFAKELSVAGTELLAELDVTKISSLWINSFEEIFSKKS